MKKFILVLLLLCIVPLNAQDTQQDVENDIETIVNDLLKPTLAKYALLATQQLWRGSIIIASDYGNIELSYATILNVDITQLQTIKDQFIEQLLPDYTKTGEALNTLTDKYIMRDVNQIVDNMEASSTYGLNLVKEGELADIYLAPEKNDDGTSQTGSFSEGLAENGVETHTLLSRYGDLVSLDMTNFEVIMEEYNLDAIVKMTNFYEKFDAEKAAEYEQYLSAILELAEAALEVPNP